MMIYCAETLVSNLMISATGLAIYRFDSCANFILNVSCYAYIPLCLAKLNLPVSNICDPIKYIY